MNFIREEETKRVLSNCRSVTPQWLLDYFLEHDTDSDCDYIFENLPSDIHKQVDDLAAQFVKNTRIESEKVLKQIEEVSRQTKEVDRQTKCIDVLTDCVIQYNKQNKIEIYQIQQQLENVRELNRHP
ncbi:hypothetical protein IIV31_107L [Armadillidium vulgare iridescent virus]|uniref:Uncharacterized protein n=1 Tax=Armadillidium vulgare iridescent virus TaxID=72201 RepID=A0A068QLQ3_9VIRU|nr:hypothetical protein IIV31_107L [Armadillidium vulgare iridescent virus]CCV02479.1 hypothetical protein IIV31_107L [Armadillidium vulgare iridescent virus]